MAAVVTHGGDKWEIFKAVNISYGGQLGSQLNCIVRRTAVGLFQVDLELRSLYFTKVREFPVIFFVSLVNASTNAAECVVEVHPSPNRTHESPMLTRRP